MKHRDVMADETTEHGPTARMCEIMASSRARSLLCWSVVGLTTVVVVGPRFAMLEHGLWHDEVTTARLFVANGPTEILFGDFRLNNHVLFSLAAWATTQVFGTSDLALRAPSFLPGVAGIVLLGWWLAQRYHPVAGIFGALIIASSTFHLTLVPQARGYGLAYLFVSLFIVLGDALMRRVTPKRLIAFGAAGFLAASTVIVLAAPFAGLIAALTFRWRRHTRTVVRLVVTAGAAGLATLAVMGSILFGDSGSFTGGVSGGAPLQWHSTVSLWLREDWAPIIETVGAGWRASFSRLDLGMASRNVWIVGLVTLLLAGAAVMRTRRMSGETSRLLLLSLPPVVTTFAVMHITQGSGNVPYRYISSIFVFLVPLLAVGLIAVVEWIAATLPGKREAATVLIGAGATLLGLVGVAKLAVEHARLPIEANKEVASVINQVEGTIPVITNSVRTQVLEYYVTRSIEVMDAEAIDDFVCNHAGQVVVLNHPYRTTTPRGPCLESRRSVTIRFDQRGRGGRMEIFFVEGRPQSAQASTTT